MPEPRITVPVQHVPDLSADVAGVDLADAELPQDGVVEVHDDDEDILDQDREEGK